MDQAASARKRGGQGDRRRSRRQRRCRGKHKSRLQASRAMRRLGRNLPDSGVCEPVMLLIWIQSDDMPCAGAASTLSVERHAVKFHSVIYQTTDELFRDLQSEETNTELK